MTRLDNDGDCKIDSADDQCEPCTQVTGACLDTCEHCELCVGKTTLPPDCLGQTCPSGQQPCGLPGQAPCGTGTFCNTGCCAPIPQ